MKTKRLFHFLFTKIIETGKFKRFIYFLITKKTSISNSSVLRAKLLSLSLIFGLNISFAQTVKEYIVSDVFQSNCNSLNDETVYYSPLSDSTSGIWNISQAYKSTINSPSSGNYLIITDSINPYPVNDSSAFMVKQIDRGGFGDNQYGYPHTSYITGSYWCNTDSLNDFGSFEIKLPCIEEWIDLTADSIFNYYTGMMELTTNVIYWDQKPVLTGNSNGWRFFSVNLAQSQIPFFCTVYQGDTIQFRFRFHSDSIFDSLDGLAFDEIEFCNYYESIDEYYQNSSIKTYPNPSNDFVSLAFETPFSSNLKFKIENSVSQPISVGIITSEDTKIDVSKLSPGWYTLNCFDEKNQLVSRSKFVVQ